jgi:nucleotide-binding universal stress UspA family protein
MFCMEVMTGCDSHRLCRLACPRFVQADTKMPRRPSRIFGVAPHDLRGFKNRVPSMGGRARGARFALRPAMSTFKHVLVATDLHEPAERAEQLGVEFAEKFGAKLTLLFVFCVPNANHIAGSYWNNDLERQARMAFDTKTAQLKKRLPALRGDVRTGAPWEEILAEAKETGIDLIVMGTRGRRGLPRALLGSVAERVVRMATVPVLTVALSEREREASVGTA